MTDHSYTCSLKRKVHKEAILEQGIELMYVHGYHGTGVNDIARASGILKGSFYNYFESKEEFCQEALLYYAEKTTSVSRSIVEQLELSPLQKLQAIYKIRIELFKNNPEHLRGCFVGNIGQELADTHKNINKTIESCIDIDKRLQMALITKAQEIGQLGPEYDAAELTEFIMNAWQGALLRIKSAGSEKPLEVFYDYIFNKLFFRSILRNK